MTTPFNPDDYDDSKPQRRTFDSFDRQQRASQIAALAKLEVEMSMVRIMITDLHATLKNHTQNEESEFKKIHDKLATIELKHTAEKSWRAGAMVILSAVATVFGTVLGLAWSAFTSGGIPH
jgi:xylose isomerase